MQKLALTALLTLSDPRGRFEPNRTTRQAVNDDS